MTDELIARAVEILRRGGLVAFPTETVYGLGADAENELAVRRIFAVKGRPATHPLIVHLPGAPALGAWASRVPEEAQALAKAFWPGPLTLVLPRTGRASDAVTGGQETVALRVPAHPLALELLHAFGGGLAAPSANRFGGVSPTTAGHVRADLGDEVDLILDGGPCAVGVESTIVDLASEEPAILRPGGVPREELERVLRRPLPVRGAGAVRVPGTRESHYAPRAGLVVAPLAELARRARALAAQGKRVAVMSPSRGELPGTIAHFQVPADPAGFARALYATLREIDQAGFEVIVAPEPPPEGVGLAVRDRLARASAPRRLY
ncbi:MAG: threonylcarbamoyl-AMP synthase [Myxococcales bacterium]|nr:threonylcarbamoyl-AMP synthase [Myxococcales bacterium]